MKLPFVTRAEYERLDRRIRDLERHFVTKRNEQGEVTETLADVPLEQRKEREKRLRGMNWQQRRAWAEATDGGRKLQ